MYPVYGYIQDVIVSVPVRVGTLPEELLIFFVRPVLPEQPVGGIEPLPSRDVHMGRLLR